MASACGRDLKHVLHFFFLEKYGWSLWMRMRDSHASNIKNPSESLENVQFARPDGEFPATIMCHAEGALRMPCLPLYIREKLKFDWHMQWALEWTDFAKKWNQGLIKIFTNWNVPEIQTKIPILKAPLNASQRIYDASRWQNIDQDMKTRINALEIDWLQAHTAYETAIEMVPVIKQLFKEYLCRKGGRFELWDCCFRFTADTTAGGNFRIKTTINMNAKQGFPEKDDILFHVSRLSADALAAASNSQKKMCDFVFARVDAVEKYDKKIRAKDEIGSWIKEISPRFDFSLGYIENLNSKYGYIEKSENADLCFRM